MSNDDELVRLRQTLELYVAHTENLIERVRILEEGHNFEYIVHCHDCTLRTRFTTLDAANDFAQAHADVPTMTGSRHYHAPYVIPVITR